MFEFKLPDIGEGVHEGEITKWLVKEGDVVKADQPIVEVMTDKATVELTSPRAGRVAKLGAPVGKVLKVGETLVAIDESGASGASGVPSKAPQHPPPDAELDQTSRLPKDKTLFEGLGEGSLPTYVSPEARAAQVARAKASAGSAPPEQATLVAGKVLATPATRHKARELGIDLRNVRGSAANGRVTKEDLMRVAQAGAARPAAAQAQASGLWPQQQAAQPLPPASAAGKQRSPPSIVTAQGPDVERVPLRALRKRIYENMRRSKDYAAHFTYVEECDVSELVQLREVAKSAAERQGVKLTYLPFIVKAAVAALKRYPDINAHVDDTAVELVRFSRVNIGVAVQTERGLMVFVVHDADKKGILQIAREMQDLSEAARQGKAKPDDLQGSTFTITSLGKTGGLLATPIINYPEVGIMGVHKIEKRAVVNAAGNIVVADRMNLSFSFDHRVIDGAIGAEFAHALIRYIEDPKLLLLESV